MEKKRELGTDLAQRAVSEVAACINCHKIVKQTLAIPVLHKSSRSYFVIAVTEYLTKQTQESCFFFFFLSFCSWFEGTLWAGKGRVAGMQGSCCFCTQGSGAQLFFSFLFSSGPRLEEGTIRTQGGSSYLS